MNTILATIVTVAVLALLASPVLAASTVNIAYLSVEARQTASGIAVSPDGGYFVGVSSPPAVRVVTSREFGRWVTREVPIPSTGLVRKATAAGETSLLATLPAGPLNGLALGPGGRYLYVALNSKDAVNHGIWRIDVSSKLAERFVALGLGVEPTGLTFRENDLFVSDSAGGQILKVTPSGGVSTWKSDPLLRGRGSWYGGLGGAGSLAFTTTRSPELVATHDGPALQEFLYAANPDHGRIVRIAVQNDETAGTATTFYQSSAIEGATSIAFDDGTDGGTLLVTVGGQDKLVAISPGPDTRLRTLLQRGGLQAPAGILHQNNRLVVLNAGLAEGSPATRPAVVRITDLVLPL